jgi:DNA-directed RNA polymerase subunit M/transcription elongation factor TFIIS
MGIVEFLFDWRDAPKPEELGVPSCRMCGSVTILEAALPQKTANERLLVFYRCSKCGSLNHQFEIRESPHV